MTRLQRATIRRIRQLRAEADKLALDVVEAAARKILREHHSLDEYVMGMGAWCFTDQNGRNNYDEQDLAYLKPFAKLIDDEFEGMKLTGEPMRFTATSPVTRNW